MTDKHVLITGGAGYIGSLLTAELLRRNYRVTVLDNLLFGGESLLGFAHHPNFHFVKADVSQTRAVKDAVKDGWQKPDAVVHLAAIVGFPACQAVGKQAAWRYNVEAVKTVFEQAGELGAERFVFTSTCNVYGESSDGKPVTETSPLNPHSLYAETKVGAEEYLRDQKDSACAPIIFRLATLYGISPRPRFDLIVNQFVLDAFTNHKIWVYRKGNLRSFIHAQDTVEGIIKGLETSASIVRGETYNLGTQNYKKYNDDPEVDNLELIKGKKIDNLADLVKRYVSEKVEIEYKDITFGGDMSDISLSFEKAERALGFKGKLDVVDGVKEVKSALKSGLIHRPLDGRYRNARPFIEQ